MTINIKPLVQSKFLENAITQQYTGVKTVIDKFTVTNVTGSNVNLDVYLVPSGGTAGSSNQVVVTKTILPNQCYNIFEVTGHCLASGASIYTNSSSASALVAYITGREIT